MWRRLALVTVILATFQAANARDRWIHLRSDNFELYTTSDERVGRDALLFFEQVRRAFTEILGLKLPEGRTVSIVAFRDEQAFAPYRPQDSVLAYTMSQSRNETIVMQDLVPERYSVALHEYTHVVINQAGIKLPLWLEEGFAELYSTLTPAGRKMLVGRKIAGRLQAAQAGLLNLGEVLSADRQSPLYHENDRVGIFYAESWALVHMLKFSEAYSAKFDQVLDAIGKGEPSDQALRAGYGKSLEQIQADLVTYVHGDHLREGVINGKPGKAGSDARLAPLDPIDIDILLAGIEARGPHRHEAILALEELAKDNPGKPAPLEALTWIQLAGPNPESAVVPFRRAIAAGSRDPNLCFQYANKLRTTISEADYVAALRLAAEIDPGFSAVQQQLAAHAFNARDYGEAVTRLHLVKKLDRTQASTYYRALAFAAYQIGNAAEAKSAAERAGHYAASPEDKRLSDEMLQYINSGKPPAAAPGFGGTPAAIR
jgi:hypothetical protein